jgi:hypothetical protein
VSALPQRSNELGYIRSVRSLTDTDAQIARADLDAGRHDVPREVDAADVASIYRDRMRALPGELSDRMVEGIVQDARDTLFQWRTRGRT